MGLTVVEDSTAQLKRRLQQMDPYEFEKLIAEVWELQGYQTTVRKGSGDRGIDIEATRETPFAQKVLIQAKRYTENNKVGSEEVRKYATLFQQVPDADNVVIVTSSEFTTEAERLASDLNLKTIDGDRFSEIVKEYGNNITHSDINSSVNVVDKQKHNGDVTRKYNDFDCDGAEYSETIREMYNKIQHSYDKKPTFDEYDWPNSPTQPAQLGRVPALGVSMTSESGFSLISLNYVRINGVPSIVKSRIVISGTIVGNEEGISDLLTKYDLQKAIYHGRVNEQIHFTQKSEESSYNPMKDGDIIQMIINRVLDSELSDVEELNWSWV